jgi:hypothetical protein
MVRDFRFFFLFLFFSSQKFRWERRNISRAKTLLYVCTHYRRCDAECCWRRQKPKRFEIFTRTRHYSLYTRAPRSRTVSHESVAARKNRVTTLARYSTLPENIGLITFILPVPIFMERNITTQKPRCTLMWII